MNCPECKIFEMEADDTTRLDGEKKRDISAVYFCPGCQEYFRWCKGFRGLEHIDTGDIEKDQSEIDDEMNEIERIDGWEAEI